MKNLFFPFLPLFGAIGILSAMWTVLFFGMHFLLASLINNAVITVLNFILFSKFLKTDYKGAFMYLPVLLWFGYLLILNYAIFMIN
jgi:tryptophan-rich sensory protein